MSQNLARTGVRPSLVRFGRLWLALFALSAAAAFGGNLVARMPIGAVVDVVLAATVCVMAALLLFEGFQAAASLIRGRSAAALGRLLLAVTVLVLPAAPLLAFDGYAWLRHEPLLGVSQVYDVVIGWLGAGLAGPARAIAAVVDYCLRGGSGYGDYLAQTKIVLEIIYYALGIGAALHALRFNTRNGLEPI
jgi:hypothetical protein